MSVSLFFVFLLFIILYFLFNVNYIFNFFCFFLSFFLFILYGGTVTTFPPFLKHTPFKAYHPPFSCSSAEPPHSLLLLFKIVIFFRILLLFSGISLYLGWISWNFWKFLGLFFFDFKLLSALFIAAVLFSSFYYIYLYRFISRYFLF